MLNLGLNTEELTITTTDVTPGESTIPNIELSTTVVKTTIPNIETTTTVVKTTMPINDDTSTTSIDTTPVVTTPTVNPKTDFTTSVNPTTEATTIVTQSTVTDSFVANPYTSTDTLLSAVGPTYVTSPVTDDTTQVDVMTTGALIGTDGTDITEGQGIITTSHAVASKAESNFRYKYILP
jgi:hypothetical protein